MIKKLYMGVRVQIEREKFKMAYELCIYTYAYTHMRIYANYNAINQVHAYRVHASVIACISVVI